MRSFSLLDKALEDTKMTKSLNSRQKGQKDSTRYSPASKRVNKPCLVSKSSGQKLIISFRIKNSISLADDINQSCVTRVPFDEQRALPEECFDLIAKSLSGESAATTQCVFRCDNDGADVDCDADLENLCT